MTTTNQNTAPCHVYTSEWVARLTQKYKNKPTYQQSRLYRFVATDRGDPVVVRQVIERWVDELSPTIREKTIENLRSEENHVHTFNELRIGNSMREFGYTTSYEPALAGKTPDWFVERDTGNFFVECLTSNPAADQARCDEGWHRFAERIATMPGPWVISMRPPNPTYNAVADEEVLAFAPEAGRQKEIMQAIRDWLKKDLQDDDEFDMDGIDFHQLPGISKVGHLHCGLVTPARWGG